MVFYWPHLHCKFNFSLSEAKCARYKTWNRKGKRYTYCTNTSTLFLHSYFLRFRQKCWHSVNFWLLWGLNYRHKQTAGVGVYDNNNEKLLWGRAEKWSRVKLPGLLRPIIVCLITTSLLFASTSQVLSSWQTQQQQHRIKKKGANRNYSVQKYCASVCYEWTFTLNLHCASHCMSFKHIYKSLKLIRIIIVYGGPKLHSAPDKCGKLPASLQLFFFFKLLHH